MTRRAFPLLVVLALTGCAGWRRVELPPDTTLARRQQVQIWRGTTATVVHAVRVTPDTVAGVPYLMRPSCDTCAIAIPRNQVDSLRFGAAEGNAMALIILPTVALLVVAWMFAGSGNGT